MLPVLDHIHITVSDLHRAEAFYDLLLPLLGFDLSLKERDCVPEHNYQIIEYHHCSFSFGIVNPRIEFSDETINRRKPGALHHLAFRAGSKSEVDTLFSRIQALPVPVIHPPRYYPEYCKDYYAFFFKDSEGIEYEVVSFARKDYFPE